MRNWAPGAGGSQIRSRLREIRLGAPFAIWAAVTLALLAVILPARWSGALQSVEMSAYDRLIAFRGAGPGEQPRVALLGVTEADIARFGWPLSDGALADLILKLHAERPRGIGMDIFRPQPSPPGSDRLDAAIASVPELVWVDRFSEGSWAGIAAPAAAAGRAGFSDVLLDAGGVARRGLLFLDDGKTTEFSLPLRLALLYLRAERVRGRADPAGNYMLGKVALPPLQDNLGGWRGIDTRGYQIPYEYPAPQTLRAFSLADLMDGRVSSDSIAGHVVMVGIVADSVRDIVLAPVDESGPRALPGATLHGLFVAQLIAHGLDGLPRTHPLSRLTEFALIVAAIAGGGLAGAALRRPLALAAATLGGAFLIGGATCVAFLHALWLPGAVMAGGWVLAAILARIGVAQMEANQRVMLMRLFSTHIAAPIAREMWNRRDDILRLGRPVPVRLCATVLFSDINDFTTITEDMEPEAIVAWLDPYMVAMTRLVDLHGGVVERFSGDGILAMFGVPVKRESQAEIAADARAAVRCASEMARAIEPLNAAYRAAGDAQIRFAVGIQSGTLVGCCLGSDERQQYTTMGDTTNTAARLVNVAKDAMKAPGSGAACAIVVGEATRALIDDAFPSRPLGPVGLKGKANRTEAHLVAMDFFAAAPPLR